MSTAGYIDTALAVGQFAANLAGRKQGKVLQRYADRAQKKNSEANRDYQRYQFDQMGRDINRNAYSQQQNDIASLNDRGVLHSSIRTGDEGRIEDERARRMEALTKKQENTEENWSNEDYMRNLQKAMKRNGQNLAMVNAAIEGGLSGVAQYYGAPEQNYTL